MCVGKTTVGKALAKELGMTFYDLDWYIEERFHTKVSRIFAEEGEERFRDLERRMLHEVAEFENVVVSCGGGTPCHFDNMDYLNTMAETVYLKADTPVLAAHLMMGKVERPLIKGKNKEELIRYIEETMKVREPFYLKAKHVLDVSLMDNYEKVKTSVNLLIEELEK